MLDVFDREPLPEESRLWEHESVRITPHISSVTVVSTAIQQVVDNYERCQRGDRMFNVVDVGLGY